MTIQAQVGLFWKGFKVNLDHPVTVADELTHSLKEPSGRLATRTEIRMEEKWQQSFSNYEASMILSQLEQVDVRYLRMTGCLRSGCKGEPTVARSPLMHILKVVIPWLQFDY